MTDRVSHNVERRGNGWGFRFSYRDGGGRRVHVRRQGFQTKAEARAALMRAMSDARLGRGVSGANMTVAEYLGEWIIDYERSQSRKLTTVKSKRSHVESYLVPRLGGIRLGRLSSAHLQRLYGDLLVDGRTGHNGTGGLSPKTVRDIAGTIHKALKDAVRRGYIPRNPADDVDLPRWERPEMETYDEAQVATFLREAARDGDPLAALWHVMFATGIRRGEMMGLRWQDVDLVAGTISIVQTRVESGTVHRSTPKTPAARRRITLDTGTVVALANLKNAQEDAADRLGGWSSDLVATDLDGTPILPRTLTRRFQAIARTAGLPVVRLHATRHTHATIMFDNGVPVHLVSRRLGHTSVATTADVYVARMPSADRAAADTWATVLQHATGADAEGRRKDAEGRRISRPDTDYTQLSEPETVVSCGPRDDTRSQVEATPRIERPDDDAGTVDN